MSGKMKANPGSGRIWNLIMGVFRGRPQEPSPQSPRRFFSANYSVASAVDIDCKQKNSARTLSSCSSVKFPNVYRLLAILGKERCP